MLSKLIRMKWPLPVMGLVLVLVVAGGAVALSSSEADGLVVYNGRAHYGDEQMFEDFEQATGIHVILRGGTGPELYERLRQEGDDTPADVLVTTDLANLWRAEHDGLLQPVRTPELERNVPARFRDPDDHWWGLSTRMRIPVVSTERVPAGAVTSYESLADPRFRGRTCLRTSNNEYNQSLVADMIVKRGYDETERLLRSWMANDPKVLNSDGEMLAVMAAGDCDVGLSNHYYLARALQEDEDFPVAPAWPDQDGSGAHTNLSGAGVVRGTDRKADAIKLLEFLTASKAQEEIIQRGEFAANPTVAPVPQFATWAEVKQDPIDVQHAGPKLAEAIALMAEVGWN